jgi:hypothetical protein
MFFIIGEMLRSFAVAGLYLTHTSAKRYYCIEALNSVIIYFTLLLKLRNFHKDVFNVKQNT